ncbi:MAG: nitroreductase family protein [Chloroflexi bacterium]|jgi:iodotyrosine deiodinase|nr:nitroreductase family protein [Chloroflexota bacterium]MBT3670428.1 nitroreductase family protein [Chloroflexota bacterium]MBT4002929.1 nitroreductase family protein [Chloroflexota bacterium]MBT4304670.1 nitroreductase family protein [Chloroflexota bacterium]MBT4532574.1 nitroreductase family protein [Chloroflexota bacterium]
MSKAKFIPLEDYQEFPLEDMKQRAQDFYADVKLRRTVRDFSNRPVPKEIIDNCILTAGTAPNGANLQPWHFVVIGDPAIKQKIRLAAEKEESDFYNSRAPQPWLDALEHLGTDQHKPFLETAPYLIAIMAKSYDLNHLGEKVKNYYVKESVGIATGLLITAIHHAGLVSLTHTPSPMDFLNEILDRPVNEKPFLLLVVGYPAEDATVPHITKKSLDEIVTYK